MNDRGNEHAGTGSLPVGLEIRGSAHAFDHPFFPGHSTFFEYTMIYKNELPFEDAYFSFFAETELGDFSDDYVGSDSLLHMGYTYNSSDVDGRYGAGPPALGVTFLDTPLAEPDGLDNDRDGLVDEPEGEMIGVTSVMGGYVRISDKGSALAIYNFMQGKRHAGEPVYEGSIGWAESNKPWPEGLPMKPTRFVFSGDPVTRSFWSEMNMDGLGTPSNNGDRQFVTTTGPFTLAPGDTAQFKIGLIWARGDNHLDSVARLRDHVKTVQSNAAFYFSAPSLERSPLPPEPNYVLGFKQNYPNPFFQTTTLSYNLPKPMQVRLAVYDILGREVSLLVQASQDAGAYSVDFNAGALPGGVYFARIELDYLRFTKRMVLLGQ